MQSSQLKNSFVSLPPHGGQYEPLLAVSKPSVVQNSTEKTVKPRRYAVFLYIMKFTGNVIIEKRLPYQA